MPADSRVAMTARMPILGAENGAVRTEPPMKALANFIMSLIAIKSDGSAGAVLLREH